MAEGFLQQPSGNDTMEEAGVSTFVNCCQGHFFNHQLKRNSAL